LRVQHTTERVGSRKIKVTFEVNEQREGSFPILLIDIRFAAARDMQVGEKIEHIHENA